MRFQLVVCTCTILLAQCAATVVASDGLLDAIWKAWEDREARFGTVEIHWKEKTFQVESGAAKTTENSFQLGANWLARYTREGPFWQGHGADGLGPGRFVDRTYFEVVNGAFSASFYGLPQNPEPNDYPVALLGKRQGSIWSDNVRRYYPIRHAFRPTEFINRVGLEIKSNAELYGGAHCVVVVVDGNTELSLDKERGYICMRHVSRSRGEIMTDMSLNYRKHDGEWVPKSWTSLNSMPPSAQEMTEKSQAFVTSVEINPRFDESVFEIRLPAATLVSDRTQGSKPVVYLLRPDGKKRIVTSEERRGGIHYQEYLNTESGEAFVDVPRRPTPTSDK